MEHDFEQDDEQGRQQRELEAERRPGDDEGDDRETADPQVGGVLAGPVVVPVGAAASRPEPPKRPSRLTSQAGRPER